MGVTIDSVHIVGSDSDTHALSSIERLSRAGRQCLNKFGNHQVRTLINIGVYRDSNVVEPAIAALVQKKLGLGLRYTSGIEPVLSFDLLNGPCGFLSAVETASALLSGEEGRCLVVAGDGHPAGTADRDFPYAQIGAAALLGYTSGTGGFSRVHTASNGAKPALHGYVDLATMGTQGRETIHFAVEGLDEDELVNLTITQARECLANEQVSSKDVSLVTTSPFPGFAPRIAEELAIVEIHAAPAGIGADPHTAASIVAYSLAAESTRPDADLLFVAAGAGPIVATCLYRRNTASPSTARESR
jgi:3-oxoacyl-[acyl-carrier-protein] synthase-3